VIDVQRLPDTREMPIDKVGVKGIHYPITVLDRDRGEQHTVASINMYVNLPHHFKGTHMSRFIEILNENRGSIDIRHFSALLPEIKRRLNAESAHVEMTFPYFITKQAPVSKAEAMVDYEVTYSGEIAEDNNTTLYITVKVPITTVCPCSREISDRGAHNQRGLVTLSVRMRKFVWLEDLISLVERAGSGELYALLKREDEKFCTESAYDKPRFVEDVVREVGAALREDKKVDWFKVESENIESIHNHNAYACIEMTTGQ
jgi:GTP cyclohydrolase I